MLADLEMANVPMTELNSASLAAPNRRTKRSGRCRIFRCVFSLPALACRSNLGFEWQAAFLRDMISRDHQQRRIVSANELTGRGTGSLRSPTTSVVMHYFVVDPTTLHVGEREFGQRRRKKGVLISSPGSGKDRASNTASIARC
jgi:hypothetical protein